MIVCSCNVISDAKIRASVNGSGCPRTPGAVYKCLGCSPNCGRCFATVKSIISEALSQVNACPVGTDAACHQAEQMVAPAPMVGTIAA